MRDILFVTTIIGNTVIKPYALLDMISKLIYTELALEL